MVAVGPCLLAATAPAGAQALPQRFSDTTVFSGLNLPTSVDVAPDGRVFVAEKSGMIKVFDGLNDSSPTTFANLRTLVYNIGDRGLLSLRLDPEFPDRPYVYVAYTYDAPIGGTAPLWGAADGNNDPCRSPRCDRRRVCGEWPTRPADGEHRHQHDVLPAGADQRLVSAVLEPLHRWDRIRCRRLALYERR